MGDWSKQWKVKGLFRERTKVLFRGEWFRIDQVIGGGHAYRLVHRDQGENHIHENVPEWMLIEELPRMARFAMNDRVGYLGKQYRVVGRRWSRSWQGVFYSIVQEGTTYKLQIQEYQLQPWEPAVDGPEPRGALAGGELGSSRD